MSGKKRKIFQNSWVEQKEFKAWLKGVPGDEHKAFCICCNANIICGKSELEKHSKSSKHIKNMENATVKIADYHVKLQKRINSAVQRLKEFIVEQEISEETSQVMIPFLRSCFPDSAILRDMNWDCGSSTSTSKEQNEDPLSFNMTIGSITAGIKILEDDEEQSSIGTVVPNTKTSEKQNELQNGPLESKETKNLTLVECQRLVLLEQLSVLRLKKEKLLDEKQQRKRRSSND